MVLAAPNFSALMYCGTMVVSSWKVTGVAQLAWLYGEKCLISGMINSCFFIIKVDNNSI